MAYILELIIPEVFASGTRYALWDTTMDNSIRVLPMVAVMTVSTVIVPVFIVFIAVTVIVVFDFGMGSCVARRVILNSQQ